MENKVIVTRLKEKHCKKCCYYREFSECDNGLCEYKCAIDKVNKSFDISALTQWLLEKDALFRKQYEEKRIVDSLSAAFVYERVLEKIAMLESDNKSED